MKDANAYPVLYKYIKEHARLMLNEGIIRVGTLIDFQDMEKHGDAVGDSAEGRKYITLKGDAQGYGSIEHYKAPGIELRGVKFFTQSPIKYFELTSPNFLLYCTSNVYNEVAMKRMGNDTCVTIHNPKAFFDEITKSLVRNGLTFQNSTPIIDSCFYKPKEVTLSGHKATGDDSLDPDIWLLKDPIYDYQTEVRALWKPTLEKASPKIIKADGIRDACHLTDGYSL